MTKKEKCGKIRMIVEGNVKIDSSFNNKIEFFNRTKQNEKEKKAASDLIECLIDMEISIIPTKPPEIKNLSGSSRQLCDQYKSIGYNKTKMTERNINLKETTNFLIRFFYITGQRYSCTQTKIGKMLSILAFQYAIKGEKIFSETIYKYPPRCGTLIKELTLIVKRDVYKRDMFVDDLDNCVYIEGALNDTSKLPPQYSNEARLPKDIQMNVEKLFRQFGSYPASELGNLLNPIVDKIVNDKSNAIDLSKLMSLNLDNFSSAEHNKVTEYIINQ